ncbi:MAG: hypothetical protein NT024_15680 [Proteobacteria bacterium]|nr:hypothetical protein [Pseudomonadota bacterium]
MAAYAYVDGRNKQIQLAALIANSSGTRVLRCRVTGTDPDALGAGAAALLRNQGAEEILQELRRGTHDADG